jgi:hypothetical protein
MKKSGSLKATIIISLLLFTENPVMKTNDKMNEKT